MKHSATFYASSFLIFGFMMICSFTSRNIKSSAFFGNTNDTKSNVSASVVIPNPRTGVLNLNCSNELQSPLSVCLINTSGNTINCKTTLNAEGIPNHKFIQLITSAYPAGEYQVVLKDVNGNESCRKIYIKK